MKNPRFTSRSPTSLHHVTTSRSWWWSPGPGAVPDPSTASAPSAWRSNSEAGTRLRFGEKSTKSPGIWCWFSMMNQWEKLAWFHLEASKVGNRDWIFRGKKLHTFGLKTEKLDLRLKKLSISQAMKEKLQSHDADIKIYSHLICRNP